MKSKYLIRMNEPADWIRSVDEGTQVVNDFIQPIGPHEKNEMSDTIYHKDASVPYHEHRAGYETFFIREGRVSTVLRGKHFVLEKGDIIHIPPYVAHGFVHLDEGVIWRELFQEINMFAKITNKNLVKANYPGLWEDAEFQKVYQDDYRRIVRETPVPEEVSKSSIPEVRSPGFAYSTYRFDGLTMDLIIGRWECNGVKEVWEAKMDKGLCVCWDDPHPDYELYYIVDGQVKFNILDEEFVAGPDSLIHIPPYTKHSLEVLEDARAYDCGCPARLLDLFEDMDSLKKYQSDKLNDKAFMKAFMFQHECWVTGLKKK